jgi:hypothetical protein
VAEMTVEQQRAIALARARLRLQQQQQPAGAQIPGPAPEQVAPPVEPPAPSMLQNIVGGTVRGVYEMPATLTALGEPTLQDVQQTKQALDVEISSLIGADPQSRAYQGSKILSEVISSLGIGPLVSAGLRLATAGTKAASTVAPVAEAIRTGGMGPSGAGGAPGIAGFGTRMAAGGVVGGVSGLATEGTPTSAGIGAATGAAAVPAVSAIGGVVGGLYRGLIKPVVAPTEVAETTLLTSVGGRATEAIEAQRAGAVVPATPGFQRTLGEQMEAGGMPPRTTLEALTERLRTADPQTNQMIVDTENRRIGALQAQLARINDQIEQQGRVLRPAQLDELTRARDDLLRNIEQQQTALDTAARARAAELPVGTQQFGETIATRAQQLQKAIRDTEITPAYERAMQAGGNVKVNIDSVVVEAERVLGRPLSSFDPATAPAIVRRIMALRPTAEAPVGQAAAPFRATFVQRPAAAQPPTAATLAELDDLRKAINSDITAAARGSSTLAGVETRNLLGLQRAIDGAIDTSDTLPQQAKDLYIEAVGKYRDLYAPRFREGQTGRILKPAMFGEMRIEPSQVVQRYLKDEGAAGQFVRTFAGDPQAYAAMRDGIVDRFREAAVRDFRVDPARAQEFLRANQAVLNIFERNGLNVRPALERMEAEALETATALDGLKTLGRGFADKSPEEMLRFITSDGARMTAALRNTSPEGQDAIRRALATRFSRLINEKPEDALTAIQVEGRVSPAYRAAFGQQTANEMRDRALLAVDVRKLQNNTLLQRENAVVPWFDKQKFTPEQLTALQPVIDDVRRMRRMAEAAGAGREVATPRVGALVEQAGQETAAAQPQRIQFLSTFASIIRNAFDSIEQRINRKVNAELAHIIYNNPDAVEKYLTRAAQRGRAAVQPAGVVRGAVAPAAGVLGAEVPQYYQMTEEPQ